MITSLRFARCVWLLPLLALAPNADANLITNGSFETVTPVLPASGICTTDTAVYPYSACTATGWTGNYQIGSGATNGPIGSFGIPQPDPDGQNALILQSGGSVVYTSATQSVTIPTAGFYTLTFYIANRTNFGGPQTITISLDGSAVTGGVYSNLAGTWTMETLTFDATAGGHSLTFSGLDPSSGDDSAFIDDVALNSATPEPSTTALFVLSFLGIAVALKRKRFA